MGNTLRAWIFRFLTIGGLGLMIWSWLIPWWQCDLSLVGAYVQIRPWGLATDLGTYASYIDDAQMPAFFAPFMWTYFGLAVVALLLSTFIKEKTVRIWKIKMSLPTFLIGIVGISYIIVMITAAVFASIRCYQLFGIPLVGSTWIDFNPEAFQAISYLMLGYWLGCAAGLFFLVLAILRRFIVGKPKTATEAAE